MNDFPPGLAGPETVLGNWLMPRTAEAVPATRRDIGLLTALIFGDLNREIEAMAGELLANVIDHGDGETARVRVTATGCMLRVEVYDAGTGPLQQRRTDELLDEHGRGLLIVAAFADRWGLERTEEGTRAWFEVRQPAMSNGER